MKIQDTNQKAQIIQYVNQQTRTNGNDKAQVQQNNGPANNPMDRVELSSDSRMIRKIQEAAQAAPDVRAERVAALKEKIENGTYQVSSDEIAGKMVREFLLEMNK